MNFEDQLRSLMFSIAPWRTVDIFWQVCNRFKQENEEQPLPDYALKIAQHTSSYEDFIRELWETFKQDPTKENAIAFIEAIVTASDKVWEEFFLDILDVEDLTLQQRKLLQQEVSKHKDYLQNSLLPDLIKGIDAGVHDFSNLDYRVIFLYSGALWSSGFLATVMFDGLSLRDLADLFIFFGPNDENTCTGTRGCENYANKVYTVAQILADDIIPGHMRCLHNCRHMLLPVASPLKEQSKHMPGRHNQLLHGRRIFDVSTIGDEMKAKLGVQADVEFEVVDSVEENADIEAVYLPKDGKIQLSKRALRIEPTGNLGLSAKTVASALGSKALIAHELGHVKDKGWDKVVTSDSRLHALFLKQKTDALDGNYSKVISKASLANPTEFYCEGIAVYAVAPDKLKALNPELYDYVKNSIL